MHSSSWTRARLSLRGCLLEHTLGAERQLAGRFFVARLVYEAASGCDWAPGFVLAKRALWHPVVDLYREPARFTSGSASANSHARTSGEPAAPSAAKAMCH